MKNNFVLLFAIFILPVTVAALFIINWLWSKEILESFFIGFILMSFIVFLSVFITKKTFNKSFNVFWGFLAGSFFLRMLVLLGSCYYFYKFTGVNIIAYFMSLMIFYFLYLIIEIIYYNFNFTNLRTIKKTMKQER